MTGFNTAAFAFMTLFTPTAQRVWLHTAQRHNSAYLLWISSSDKALHLVHTFALKFFALQTQKKLLIALVLCLIFLVLEVVGGVIANRCDMLLALLTLHAIKPTLNFWFAEPSSKTLVPVVQGR